MKPQLLLVWLPFVCACGAKTTTDPGDNGGNTNWLSSCAEDAECGGGDGMCVAEVCLKPCSDDDACADIANTECTSLQAMIAPSGSCDALPATSLCALRCDRDADCSDLGESYACEGGACTPTCPSTPTPVVEPSPDAGSEPVPNPAVQDECVLTIDASQCCPQAVAARRSELETSACWYEVIDGDYTQPGGLPDECFAAGCPLIPCPPLATPGWYGVAVEDEGGACVIEPTCDDASCPGSACDPAVGCDREWVDPVNGLPGLQCQATACGEPGVCVYAQRSDCGEIYAPVCGCDGVTYGNRCSWGELAPILHEGECEEQGSDDQEPYQPCATLACGAPCMRCAPNQPGCVNSDEPLSCDEHGECVDPTNVDCDGDVPCDDVDAEVCSESGCYEIAGFPAAEAQDGQLRVVACFDPGMGCEAEPSCALAPDGFCWRFPNSCIPAQYDRLDCGDPRCCSGDDCVE